MAVWIAAIIISAIIGLIGGLIENWARDDAIPNLRIILIGVAGAEFGGLVSTGVAGMPVGYAIIALTIIPLYVDRVTQNARRGL